MPKLKPPTNPQEAAANACIIAGGQRQLAKACGVAQNAIFKAVHGQLARGISAELAVKISAATKGRVKKSDLNPVAFAPRKPYTKKAA